MDISFTVKENMNDFCQRDESVDHPTHYNSGKIEVIAFIEDQKMNFNKGNALKYICRAGKKNPNQEVQDLMKAIWYLEREIALLEGTI